MLAWSTLTARVAIVCALAAMALAVPTAASACDKDTDCKGDRICEQGKCVSPVPTGRCGKDTDCPGNEICEENRCISPGQSTAVTSHELVGTWDTTKKEKSSPWVISFSDGQLQMKWGPDNTVEVDSWDGRFFRFAHENHETGFRARHLYELVSPGKLKWVELQTPYMTVKPNPTDEPSYMIKR